MKTCGRHITSSFIIVVLLLWLAGGLGLPEALAQAIVPVSFTTSTATPLTIGFAGFTTELLGTGIEYADTNMQKVASALSPGWLLYPAGTTGDAFDWTSGLTSQSWINLILANGNTNAAALCQNTYLALLGKGGAGLGFGFGWAGFANALPVCHTSYLPSGLATGIGQHMNRWPQPDFGLAV